MDKVTFLLMHKQYFMLMKTINEITVRNHGHELQFQEHTSVLNGMKKIVHHQECILFSKWQ